MFLNPDTVAREGAVKALATFLDHHPRVGLASSLLEYKDGGVRCSAFRIHSPLTELDVGARLGLLSCLLHRYVVSEGPSAEAHRYDWASGASLIVRRGVLEQVGLMDNGYFLYFDEIDFCHRAQRAGWECWYVPASRVMHLEGASTGIRAAAKRRAKYWYDSRRRFFVKHYGITSLVLAVVLWAIGRLSYLLHRGLRLGIRSHVNCDPKWFMFDLLWGDLRAILKGRVWSIPRAGQQP